MMKSSTRILLLVGLALIALNGFIVSAQIQPYNYNHHHYYKFGYSDIGDRLLDRGVGTWTSETPQDTLITISFPGRQGSYAHVSSLVINVYQDANGSEAHIIEGGIFQVTIKILIEAYSVTNVTYDYEVFGPVY